MVKSAISEWFLIKMNGEEFEPKIKSCASTLDPDFIFEEIGGFGKFQMYIYVLICLPLVFIACCNFSYIFIASDMEYRYSSAWPQHYQLQSTVLQMFYSRVWHWLPRVASKSCSVRGWQDVTMWTIYPVVNEWKWWFGMSVEF